MFYLNTKSTGGLGVPKRDRFPQPRIDNEDLRGFCDKSGSAGSGSR